MSFITAAAVYIIIWWIVLFTVLPVGVRSQQEERNIVLGTEPGAPSRVFMVRKFLLTTLISAIISAAFYAAWKFLGYGLEDIPFLPRY